MCSHRPIGILSGLQGSRVNSDFAQLNKVESRLFSSPAINGILIAAGPLIGAGIMVSLPQEYSNSQGEVREVTWPIRMALGTLAWMAIWWLTQCVPLSVTSLIPLLLIPVTGGLPVEKTVGAYLDPTLRLFLGGFLLSAAISKWGLGERFSLLTLRAVGARPANLVGGLMLVTAGLSAFVSNAATAAVMFPIALGIIRLVQQETDPESGRAFGSCTLLGIAYGASLGGMLTILGTPPNMLLVGFLGKVPEPNRLTLSFVNWLGIGPPIVCLLLPFCWWLLTRGLYRLPRAEVGVARSEVAARYRSLGALGRGEWATLFVFGSAIVTWIILPLLRMVHWEIPGRLSMNWAGLQDWHVALAAAAILFVWPAGAGTRSRVLALRDFHRVPWGVLLLFGGGLALSAALTESRADQFLAAQLELIRDWPRWLAITLMIIGVVFFSEVASNTAAVATLLPIFGALADSWQVHPATLAVPITLAASCGFMMPVATPPNAIVYSSGMISARDMLRAGWWLNWAGIVVISLFAGRLVEWFLL